MIEEQAIVVGVNGQQIRVTTDKQSGCGHCSAQSSCGTSLLGQFFSRNRQHLTLETDMALSKGDKVVLGLDNHALLQGSIIVYAIPLLMMLILPVLTSYFFSEEWLLILSAGIGLVMGLMYVKYFSAIAYCGERFRPVVLRRAE